MQCFTWNGLEENIANKIFVLAKEGGLTNICQNASRIGHCAHAYLYRPNSEMTNIPEQCFGS